MKNSRFEIQKKNSHTTFNEERDPYGTITKYFVGCVKPYTVVPKVFRLYLPTPNPIHWTQNGSLNEKKSNIIHVQGSTTDVECLYYSMKGEID